MKTEPKADPKAVYPLSWPPSTPRIPADQRRKSQFRVGFCNAYDDLLKELDGMHAEDVHVSSDVPLRDDEMPMPARARSTTDPAVAVHFKLDGQWYGFGYDRYSSVRCNLRGLTATLEALRTMQRHGTPTMTRLSMAGFMALPAHATELAPARGPALYLVQGAAG